MFAVACTSVGDRCRGAEVRLRESSKYHARKEVLWHGRACETDLPGVYSIEKVAENYCRIAGKWQMSKTSSTLSTVSL